MNSAVVTYVRALVDRSRFLRFLISGGINTVATYAVYLALLRAVDYRISYTIAYVVGILLSYALNWLFVFRTHRGLSSAMLFPFVYLAQYAVSLATVWIWVDRFGLPKSLAPLIAIMITIPLTYFLSKGFFVQGKTIRHPD